MYRPVSNSDIKIARESRFEYQREAVQYHAGRAYEFKVLHMSPGAAWRPNILYIYKSEGQLYALLNEYRAAVSEDEAAELVDLAHSELIGSWRR